MRNGLQVVCVRGGDAQRTTGMCVRNSVRGGDAQQTTGMCV